MIEALRIILMIVICSIEFESYDDWTMNVNCYDISNNECDGWSSEFCND